MPFSLPASVGTTARLTAFCVLATLAAHSTGVSAETKDQSLDLQKARQKIVDERGAAVHYTKRWNLDDLPAYVPKQQVAGTLRLWGSNYITDGKLAGYWMEAFHKYQPNVSFTYHMTTSGVAITGLVAHLADIGVNHKIMWKELLVYQREFGHDPLEVNTLNGSLDVPGWSHASIVIANAKNPVEHLTLNQLDGIFGSERSGGWVGTQWHPEYARGPEDNIRTWGQAGLTGSWADKPIHVLGLNLKYDAADDFSRWVLKGSDKWNEGMRLYANYVLADGSFGFGEKMMIEDISKDPYAIGNGPGLADMIPGDKVVALAAEPGAPYVAPTLETCRDQSYPLHEEVYFYVDRIPGKPLDPKVDEFTRFVLSREGQEAVQRDGKYLPMPASAVREQLKKWE